MLGAVPASDGTSNANRSWLTNSSYQPAPPPPQPPPKDDDDRAPSSKRAKEDKKSREKEQKKGATVSKPITVWLEDCGLTSHEAYRLDGGGDRANLQYSALYSGDIATYRRRFGGQCLGLGPGQSIEWTDNRGSKMAKKSRERTYRYFTSNLPQNDACLYLGAQLSHNEVSTAVASSRQSHAPFFMGLEPSSSTKHQVTEEGEEKCDQQLTSEVYVSQKTASYNRALQDDPHNVALWLEFLEFQPVLQAGSSGGGGVEVMDTSKAARALNERKLAIFERALEYNPTSQDLLVAHLQLLRDVDTEPQAMMKRWRDLLFRMPNKPLLWIRYTEFTRTQFSTFSLSSLTTLYHKAFSTLTSILEGVMKSHAAEQGTDDNLLALFSQFTHCLAAAGQNERAIACYQALVEFNLGCPSSISSVGTSSKERVEFFEPFWDSGAPRLGETRAVGWGQWMEATQTQTPTKPLAFINTPFLSHSGLPQSSDTNEGSDPELELITGCSLPEAWLRLENHRQMNDALPFRGSEDDLSDPERAVLFEDVSQSLFRVDDPTLRLKLVLGYLQFLGVELSQGGSPCLDSLPHLLSPHLYCPFCSSGCPSLIASTRDNNPSSLYHHNFCGVGAGYRVLSTNDLLTTGAIHSLPSPAMSQFITNTFNQILSLLPDPESQSAVAVEWVRFELSLISPALHDPAHSKTKDTRGKTKAVQKLVKSLLKHESHRNNLALWDTCSQLESLVSGPQEAQALYESVLSQYSTLTPPLLPLYQHYCELLMGLHGNIGTRNNPSPEFLSRALQLTVCVAEGRYTKPVQSSPPGSAVLRARHLFHQHKPTPSSSPAYLLCHAYFEYLCRGLQPASRLVDDIVSARETLLSTLSSSSSHYDHKELRTLKLDLQTLYHHHVTLLLSHSESKPMPLTLLWGVLERALAIFPDDPFLLSSYTDSQQPLYLMGKLRKYFDSHTPRAQTALPWIHAVRAEVARYRRVSEGEMEGETDVPAGLVNRITALLNRAIQSVNGRGCPLLWRLAMSFEVNMLGSILNLN